MGRYDHMAMGHDESRGLPYTKFEDLPQGEKMMWGPSIRAVAKSKNYEDYLRLMNEYASSIEDDVESSFPDDAR